MSVQINFDASGRPEAATLVLAKKNGDKLGQLNAKSLEGSDVFNNAEEFSFVVYKYVDGVKDYLWDEIVDFKLVYCVEWDSWFEISVEYNEAVDRVKTVTCKQLGHAELSNIYLYGIQINTGDDITRSDYDKDYPTVLYRDVDNASGELKEKYRTSSLLHRIMEKAPHYKVIHVDESIANEQREFAFDGTTILDAFNRIAEEINCMFVLNERADSHNKGDVYRTISVYDLESTCKDCGHRDDFFHACSKCGSENIKLGYGEDTAIFITSDELAETIQLSTGSDSVKNCFKLEAGDDLMTAYVTACNPNGTSYIWNFSENMKKEMSQELRDKITEYDALYDFYQNENSVSIDVKEYNDIVAKYPTSKVDAIDGNLVGYASLMEAYFGTIDFNLYLTSGLLPSVELYKTTAKKEAEYLEKQFKTTNVALSSINVVTKTSADNAVLAMAEALTDPRYKVEILEEETTRYNNLKWTGKFVVTSLSYNEDNDEMVNDETGMYKHTTQTITIVINDDYETFVKQKVEKQLAKNDADDMSITKLFEKELEEFKETLKQYGLNSLSAFDKACEACLNILITESSSWAKESDLEEFYGSYVDRQTAIRQEMSVREAELQTIADTQDAINEEKEKIQNALNFESFVGEELMLEFSCFRREDRYNNPNYISDGLDTGQLFENAYKFLEVATKEIKKASELQHSINTTLKNLLVIHKFKPIIDKFKVGNWLRIMIDDVVYRFRLTKFRIDYENLSNIDVEISDVATANSSIKNVMDIIAQASSMATSYESVKRQAKQGEQSKAAIDSWSKDGLDATLVSIVSNSDNQSQTWDENGMLFREYDPITNSYGPEQMKIVNSTLAVTDDNWETIKTAVGKFQYKDKLDGNKLKTGYGINAEAIVGQMIMGEDIILENEAGTLSFNESGLRCKGTQAYEYAPYNTTIISPNDNQVFTILKTSYHEQSGGAMAEATESVFAINGDGDVMARAFLTADSIDITPAVANEEKIRSMSGGFRSGIFLKGLANFAFADEQGRLTSNAKSALTDEVRNTTLADGSSTTFSAAVSGLNTTVENLSDVAYSGDAADLLNLQSTLQDKTKSGLHALAFSGHANNLGGIQSFALQVDGGQMTDIGKQQFNDFVSECEILNTKLDNPENHYNSTEGQILMRTEDGSKWIDLSELKEMLNAL